MILPSFVRTSDGKFLVQAPDDSQFGFSLLSDDQAWPGGFGVASEWTLVRDDDVPTDVREQLQWVLDDVRERSNQGAQ